MNRFDFKGQAKKLGRSWEVGKSFEKNDPLSELVPASETVHLEQSRICLQVNEQIKQYVDLYQMIWSVLEMISYLSRFYDIVGRDLVMSGPPLLWDLFNGAIRQSVKLETSVL